MVGGFLNPYPEPVDALPLVHRQASVLSLGTLRFSPEPVVISGTGSLGDSAGLQTR